MFDIRILPLLRVFRVFKLTAYVPECQAIGPALRASHHKILVLATVLKIGKLRYGVEGPTHGLASIPTSFHWAIATMTKVGFGASTSRTDLAHPIEMLLDCATLAVPADIVTAEMSYIRNIFARCCQHAHLP